MVHGPTVKSKKLTVRDTETLRQMYVGNLSRAHIEEWLAQHGYTYTWDTLRHVASNLRWSGRRMGPIPAPRVTLWNEAPRIEQDCVCLLDMHTPYHDAKFIEQVLDVAVAWGVRRAVMDGDAWDVDWLSWFERDPNLTPDAEIRAWRDVSAVLLDALPDGLDIHMGNHAERIRRLLRNMDKDARAMLDLVLDDKEPEEVLYANDSRIRVTPYHYCRVHGVLVGHPSATGTNVGLYVMESYDTDCVLGHTHYAGTTYDRADRHVAVEVGGCFSPSKLRYISCRLPARARGKQRQGAAIIIKSPHTGRSHIYHLRPRFTDFKALAQLYRV